MRNRFSLVPYTLAALLPMLTTARPLVAQRDGSWEFSGGVGGEYIDGAFRAFLGGHGFSTKVPISAIGPAAAVRLGYNFTNHWGYSIGISGAKSSGVTFVTPFAALTLTGNLNAKTSPFITAGTQITRATGNGNKVHPTWGAHLGVGLRRMVSDQWALRVEGRMGLEHFAELPGPKNAYNSVATIGLSYFTHGRRQPAPRIITAAAPSCPVCARPLPPRVDTVRVVRRDTIRTVRVDTVRVRVMEEILDQIILRVQFRTNRSELLPISYSVLNNVARAIKGTPNSRWAVEGHTDNVGTVAHNQVLSQARAQTVVDYLVRQGVPRDILEAHGWGSARPVFNNIDAAARAQNRRVQLRRIPLSPTGAPVP